MPKRPKSTLKEELAWLDKLIVQLHDEGKPDDRAMAEAIKHRLNGVKSYHFKHYQKFIDRYTNWYKGQVGVPPKLGPAHGKAMKEIILYLVKAGKDETEEGALKAWDFILNNFHLVSAFLQQQKGLLHINKNLDEILDHIRNGHAERKKQAGKQELSRYKESLRGF